MKGLQGRDRLLRATELLLWAVAVLCLGATAHTAIEALGARRSSARITPQIVAAASTGNAAKSASDGGSSLVEPRRPMPGEVIGRVEIPALGLTVPMTAGIETNSLLRGVGHIEGTAEPGGLGTLGLAGHRDTYLRPLHRVAAGMDIRVINETGTYHYSVDSTEIVLPEQVDVLAIRSRPELTLVTCYPFYFIGSAPKRFIVHAHLLSAAPDAIAGGGRYSHEESASKRSGRSSP